MAGSVRRIVLAALLLAVGGCSYRFTNVSPERAPEGAIRAKEPLQLRAVCDDGEVARLLAESARFSHVEPLGANPAWKDVGAIVGMRMTTSSYPPPKPMSGKFLAFCEVFFLPVTLPFLFVYFDIAPNAQQTFELTCWGPAGDVVARYATTAEFLVEAQPHRQVDDPYWWVWRPEMRQEVEALGRAHATRVLVAKLAADESLAERLRAAPPPELLSCALVGHHGFAAAALQHQLAYDGQGGRFVAKPVVAIVPLDGRPVDIVDPAAVPGLDRDALRRIRASGPLFLKLAGSDKGRPCWWVVGPGWERGAGSVAASMLVGELYQADPDSGALPVEVAVVARRGSDGSWTPERSYLRNVEGLVAVTAAIEGGRVVLVDAQPVAEPPLEDFLVAKESLTAEARWRNRALLVAKTRTVPKLLDERKTSELEALALRIEQLVLDLNRESELLKDQAQKVLAHHGGQAPPGAGADALRDLSLAYQERIEILKPILAAVKDEIANRRR